MAERPAKKARITAEDDETLRKPSENPEIIRNLRAGFLSSLQRDVSPPPRKIADDTDSGIKREADPSKESTRPAFADKESPSSSGLMMAAPAESSISRIGIVPRVVKSPFQLTRIRDLPADHNQDTVSIGDLICDPMIKEIWLFDYLFDPDWIMQNLDPDTRLLTKVVLVHGSWRAEADNRIRIVDACSRYSLMFHVTAYIPDAFGTHHTKMMVLFRHDDTCEVVIHTANMIPQDWKNMTQGLWRTGQLPLHTKSLAQAAPAKSSSTTASGERHPRSPDLGDSHALGSGKRFKHDLLLYLKAYSDKSSRLKLPDLTKQIEMYDFGSVRGALVASVPRKIPLHAIRSDRPLWGWPSLQNVLRSIPMRGANPDEFAHIIAQVSSIATLGSTDEWLREALTPTQNSTPSISKGADRPIKPRISVLYPTPRAIRNSLDGYQSGASIHLKLDSIPAQKQITWLRPFLCDWSRSDSDSDLKHLSAGRSLAAPHVKTYIRFRSSCLPPVSSALPGKEGEKRNEDYSQEIDWALLTSANLSTQAWGSTGKNEVVVKSYELGVLVWPELFGLNARMVPTFQKDTPSIGDQRAGVENRTLVGLRMPYDLPLCPYQAGEDPWCPTLRTGYTEPDRFGGVWRGYSDR